MELLNNYRKNFLPVWGLTFTLILTVSIFMLVFQVHRRQNLKSQALNPTAVLSFSPTVVTKAPGETFTVWLIMNTNGQPVIGGDFLINFNSDKLTLLDISWETHNIFKTYTPLVNNTGIFDKNSVIMKANSASLGGILEFGIIAYDPSLNGGTGGPSGSFNGLMSPVSILTFQVKTGTAGSANISYKYTSSGNTTDTNIIANNNGTPQDILSDPSSSVVNVTIGSLSPTPPNITATPTPSCPLAKQGDINCSGKVNALDLSILLGKFGTADVASDLNSSGKVNALDMSILLSNFGRTSN